MSRIGKNPISIPSGVEVTLKDQHIAVKGPKGTLSYDLHPAVKATVDGSTLSVQLINEEFLSVWGTSRTIVANLIEGVTKGYEKKLMVYGVGYGVKQQGNKLVLSLGLSHTVDFILPEGISASVAKDQKGTDIITLTGIDKYMIGQTAANLKSLKKPDPYKGKGIRFVDEVIKLKVGKTSKK